MSIRRWLVSGAVVTASLLAVAFAAPAVLANDVTVTTLADSNTPGDAACSLREAIVATNLNLANTNPDCPDGNGSEPDRILFAVSGTIGLSGNLPSITDSVDIDANHSIVIDGQDTWKVFTVLSGGLSLFDLAVQDGFAGNGFGGAVSNGASTILNGVTVRSSTAGYGGGIHNNGSMLILASTIEGNQAGNAGGGIFNEGDLTLRNVTITGNSAPQGGGIYSSGTATIAHATIVRNTADSGGGGGIYRAGGTVFVASSILVGNTGNQRVGDPQIAYSVVQTSADGVVDTALRDNGGATRTIRLPAGSKALAIGDPDWCDWVGYVDQRGLARPTGSLDKCDAGAVQRDRVKPTMTKSPKIVLRTIMALSGSSLRARLQEWQGSDGTGIGVERFSLQRQVNGGSWTSVTTTIPADPDIAAYPYTGMYNVTLGKDTRYRFRIRAVDEDGNYSSWSYTPTVTARLYQQTSSRFTFSSGWTTASSSKYSGGSLKYTTTDGKSFRFVAKGRTFALVTTLRPSVELRAEVFHDGVSKGMSNVLSSTLIVRAQAFVQEFSSSATRTLRFVVDGTNRFDVDAFAVLE